MIVRHTVRQPLLDMSVVELGTAAAHVQVKLDLTAAGRPVSLADHTLQALVVE